MADTVDEDTLDRESPEATRNDLLVEASEESQGEPIVEFKNKGGRPVGYPKAPNSGRILGEIPIKSVLRDLIAFHRGVVEGKLTPKLGPTGKVLPGGTAPTLEQKQTSAAALARLLTMAADMKAEAKANPTPADPEEVRRVLADMLPRPAVEAEPIDSTVVSISDPDAIADFDAALTPDSSDVIQLGEGFTAHRDIQAGTGKTVYRCFNERGEFCANKATPEAAKDWFTNNTPVGQALSKRGAA
jgi:hypothetical protein